METTTVTILMATYNGEAFIKKQIGSLTDQTYTNWRLIIRDDGSTDNTLAVIKELMKTDARISLIVNNTHIKGACSNFSALFDYVKYDESVEYIMFCDQDDIWLPEKIRLALDAIKSRERQLNNGAVLVYSNLALMDAEDNIVPGGLKIKHRISLNTLMIFNYVLGCTTILNKALIDKIDHIPLSAENHDYWIALVASLNNHCFLDQKLICYRQHDQNASGNIAGNNSLFARFKRNMLAPANEIKILKKRLNMLAMFFDKYSKSLSPQNKKLLSDYLLSFKQNRLKTMWLIIKNQMFRNGFFQSVASVYVIVAYHKQIAEGVHLHPETIEN